MKYWGLLLLLCGSCGYARAETESYDKPIKTVTISLPENHDQAPWLTSKPILTCYYYNGFMVKQIDSGGQSADKLSITSSNHLVPCKENTPGEIVIDEWAHFDGAKGIYVFFAPEDSFSNVFTFGIFSGVTGKELFEYDMDADASQPAVMLSGNGLQLKYRRAYRPDCSIHEDTAGCWRVIRKAIDIGEDIPPPSCNAAYEEAKQTALKYPDDYTKAPILVGYEATLTYASAKITIVTRPGKINCWVED